MKVRIKFRKYGILRFIGHLDVMRCFQKAMRRADIPIAFTGGYSPHMIMSFAQPLGIGLTSDGEYMDIELKQPVSSSQAVSALNGVMPEGLEVVSFRQISSDKKASGMTIVSAADYLVSVKNEASASPAASSAVSPAASAFQADRLEAFLARPAIPVLKKTKRSEKEIDIRPLIYEAEVREEGLFLRLAAGSADNLKPELVTDAFFSWAGEEPAPLHFHRLELYAGEKESLCALEDLGQDIN